MRSLQVRLLPQFFVTSAAAKLRGLVSLCCQAGGGRHVVQFEECPQEMEDGTEPGIRSLAKSHDLAWRSERDLFLQRTLPWRGSMAVLKYVKLPSLPIMLLCHVLR